MNSSADAASVTLNHQIATDDAGQTTIFATIPATAAPGTTVNQAGISYTTGYDVATTGYFTVKGQPMSLSLDRNGGSSTSFSFVYTNLTTNASYSFIVAIPGQLAIPAYTARHFRDGDRLAFDPIALHDGTMLAIRPCCDCILFTGAVVVTVGAFLAFYAANPEFIASAPYAAARVGYVARGVAAAGGAIGLGRFFCQ